MTKKRLLPPLRALQVFETAGRCLNLTLAAAELLVSEPAVSQQIRSLEAFFGKALCVRLPRGIKLTAEGEELLRVATKCLDELNEVAVGIRRDPQRKEIRLQVTSHFSTRWLAPRLKNLNLARGRIKLSLAEYSGSLSRLEAGVDIAVFWGNKPPSNSVVEELFTVNYVPMCSDELLRAMPNSNVDEIIPQLPLLTHTDSISWEDWCERFDVRPGQLSTALDFDNYDMLVEATARGNGMSLLMYPMFVEHFCDGRLVAPFGTEMAYPLSANIAYRSGALDRPEVLEVKNWLMREAKKWSADY
ncbi:MAG TPA: LysR family transcriptional regulator [Ochrobactrum intermedium]|uniref:LysR family transcriptional regulator n=1 Tax=Brucella intermedia TaxID=94625 RepID=A0A7V6PBZ4_9HYPH|nr:LysR substrate-binding domain-containing protein [Brucella intermedia]HHV67963.1 LysR family transcriptional regulator [Brucella intermedia]